MNAAVVFTVVYGTFWLTWRFGFDLKDEGFFWYGTQKILAGEVPLRDFMSYDIGRYYWTAAGMSLLDSDGIFANRLSAATFQCIGVFAATFVCLSTNPNKRLASVFPALAIALILVSWARPYYKAFDHVAGIGIVLMLYLMLKSRRKAQWLAAGVILGLAATIGRNHGAYGAVAAVFLIGLITLTPVLAAA